MDYPGFESLSSRYIRIHHESRGALEGRYIYATDRFIRIRPIEGQSQDDHVLLWKFIQSIETIDPISPDQFYEGVLKPLV
jgi:hypothetical protein